MSTGLTSRDNFLEVLKPFQKRAVRLAASQAFLIVLAALLVTVLAFVWLDLIWALPAAIRWGVTRLGVMAGFVVAIGFAWKNTRWMTHDRLASRIDSVEETGGEVLSGFHLASQNFLPRGGISAGLADIAIARASHRVSRTAPHAVLPTDVLKRPAYVVAGILAGSVVLSALLPNIAWTQWQRFLSPSSDVPPFTGVLIEMSLEKDTVLFGEDVMGFAQVTAGNIERMSLVTQTFNGTEHVLPMLPIKGGRWQAVLTRATESMTVFAKSGISRSRMQTLTVVMTPKILPPRIRITPPAYTKRPQYVGPIPDVGIAGLKGTQVEFEVSSNRPLTHGRLAFSMKNESPEIVRLEPSKDGVLGPNAVMGSIELTKSGRFSIDVVDTDGIVSQDRIEGTIVLQQDQRPIVRIVQPKPLSLATPDVKLTVSVSAEDDYGITSVSLFRSINQSPATATFADIESSSRVGPQWELPLDRYGLEAGDEIQLFARTEDNDPDGPKGAESPVTIVKIISVQEFQEMMVQQKGAESIQAKYQAAQRHFENLAEALRELEKAAAEAALHPDSKEAQANLQEKLQEAEKAAARAAVDLKKLSEEPFPIDVDQELAQELEKMSEQAKEMEKALKEMADGQAPKNEKGEPNGDAKPLDESNIAKIKEMLEQVGENREQIQENAIEPLEMMQKTMALMADQERFSAIAAQQRDLAQRLDSLKNADPDDESVQRRVSELETEQKQLGQALDQLLEDIEQHFAELPVDPELDKLKQTSIDFLNAVKSSEARVRMTGTQQNLLGDNFQDAQQDASTSADILESFLSEAGEMSGEAESSCKAAFNPTKGRPNLGNSLQQMMKMMGMKGGKNGMKPGSKPGMGRGAGGGYAQRFPGPQNIGMYGSMPTSKPSASRGRGENANGGSASNSTSTPSLGGNTSRDTTSRGDASGQSDQSVPSQYRSQVAEYFRILTEQLGEQETTQGIKP